MKLHPIDNDTDTPEPFCGPTAIACVTGAPLSKVLTLVMERRARRALILPTLHPAMRDVYAKANFTTEAAAVKAMSGEELEQTLADLGFGSEQLDQFEGEFRPLVSDYLINKMDNFGARAVLVLSVGRGQFDNPDEGHFIAVGGDSFELVDTSTGGQPVLMRDLPYPDTVNFLLGLRLEAAWRVISQEEVAADDARFGALIEALENRTAT